ncbi:hypothetical protein PUR57_02215 [Streptomyces sp. JV176]|uniref:hypothetical protein n=1 Tax=Streptomyces sp. JV176 TaxID=858630 RepID=UPI002E7AAAAF|nr:hypothetical protein [Streptomyces sp. JV176]MEE1797510.1 hypothetical protein [Streptomyces sp. JV176]
MDMPSTELRVQPRFARMLSCVTATDTRDLLVDTFEMPLISGFFHSHGEQTRYGALSRLLTADRALAELRSLGKEINEAAIRILRLRGRLLATAEQDTGLPCIISDSEARPSSSTLPGWSWARHTTDVLEYMAKDGTTDYVMRYSQERSWSDDDPRLLAQAVLAEVTKQVQTVRGAALATLRLLISPTYSFAWSVPPNETSPCGVLRLAAPIVPGAPNVWSWLHKTNMTLAA